MNKVTIPGKTNMLEVDLIIHILSNLPEEYEVAVSESEEKLNNILLHLCLWRGFERNSTAGLNTSLRMQRPKKKKRLRQLSRSSTKVDAVTVAIMATRVRIAWIKISPVVLARTLGIDSTASATVLVS
jgi:hypothetical protein